ncbi:MAG: site-specific integrase [Anaerolineaceae bacterium]
MDQRRLLEEFKKLLAKAGLPIIRFHDLRHTMASLLLNNKVPVIVVSNMLGHSKPSVTLDIYSHVFHDIQGEAAVVMDRLVTPIPVEIPSKVPLPRQNP